MTHTKGDRMDTMVHVGADAEAIKVARDTVMDIFNHSTRGDDAVIQALKTLGSVCETNGSISNCTFLSGNTVTEREPVKRKPSKKKSTRSKASKKKQRA